MSVNYEFVHRETRDGAFQDPELLLRIIADRTPVGRNTMARMWNALAEAKGDASRVTGTQFTTWERRWDDGTRVGIVKVPEARKMTDAVMAAIVVKPGPRRWLLFPGRPEVRYFTLEVTMSEEAGAANDVVLCEWRLHGNRFEHALLDVKPPRADPDALNAAIKKMTLHAPAAISVTPKSKEPKPRPDGLAFSVGVLDAVSGDVPLIKIAGVIPGGSDGNALVATCFARILEKVDIASAPRGLLVYDMTDLQYDFGDHLGAFFWNMPTLADGVAILVAATGETRRNLESLRTFIGSWLPVEFHDSVAAISAHVRDNAEAVQKLLRKRDACSQRGQVFKAGETGVKIVLLGSRQTGLQYRTRRSFRQDSDLDCGVVGGPRELALLMAKLRNQPDLVPNVDHPPIKAFASVEEATGQGFQVIAPR